MKKNMDLISYPFLHEKERLVDHEILTDSLASTLGYILSLDTPLKDETFWLMDKVLHLNGSIRGKNAITTQDLHFGLELYNHLKEKNQNRMTRFVYPTGHQVSCLYHMARGQAKQIVRNLHLIQLENQPIDELHIDFANLVANLLFAFSIDVNRQYTMEEQEFISQSY